MRILLALMAACLLAACVEIPESPNENPSVELSAATEAAFPGGSFRIVATVSDDNTDEDDLVVTWQSQSNTVSIGDSGNGYAVVNVGLATPVDRTITVKAVFEDSMGAATEASLSLPVRAEPFVVIDAETAEVRTPETQPLYVTGAYSAARVNLKMDDLMASTNHEVSVSPDGQFVFYTQLLENSVWQAHLYSADTAINHTVNMDFEGRDLNNITAYWSRDSRYLAIEAPHQSSTDSDVLYWVDVSNVSEVAIEPSSVLTSFDTLVWSDNNVSLAEKPFAALTTDENVSIFDPASDTPVTELREDFEADSDFTQIQSDSVQWATNQLFFLGSTTIPADPTAPVYNTHLYNWKSANSKTQRVDTSIASGNVVRFDAYVATQVVYEQNTNLYFFNGIDASRIVVSEIASIETEHSEFAWSEDGRYLGVSQLSSSTNNSGYDRLSVWAVAGGSSSLINWAPATDNATIEDWQWGKNSEHIIIHSQDSVAETGSLVVASTDSDVAIETVVDEIYNDTQERANNLIKTLTRSPNGNWHLYWGRDAELSSVHLDLWAFNIETGEWLNVSKLSESYLMSADGEGEFIETTGLPNDADSTAYVSRNIHWLSEDELVFEVRDMSDNKIIDVRAVDLEDDEKNHSIIHTKSLLTKIERFIGY